MDSFTERMLERAKARQKKLEEYFHNSNEIPKIPLKEPNTILQKYENPSGLAKSQPNLSDCDKLPRKEIASDSNLNFKTQYYGSSMKENLSDSNLSKKSMTRVSSDMQIHPQSPTKTLNIQKENFNMEIKLTSADNVRVEVEIEERDESDPEEPQEVPQIMVTNENDSHDKPSIRPDVKNRLQRLGKLYSGAEEIQLSSPISRTEEKFYEEDIEKDVIKPCAGLGRLKDLASTRNQWEDEASKPATTKEAPKKSWKPPAPKPPASANIFAHSPHKGPAPQPPITKINAKVHSRDSSPEKNCKNVKDGESSAVSWDNSVLASLESQGFTRTNSNTRLVYSYKNGEENDEPPEEHLEDVEEEEEPPSTVSKISKLTSKFFSSKSSKTSPSLKKSSSTDITPSTENTSPLSPKKFLLKSTDVAPTSPKKSPSKSNLRTGEVLNKAAKFEKQQLLSPAKIKDPALMSVSERKALFEKNKGAALVPKAAFGMAAPVKNSEKNVPAPAPAKLTQKKPPSPKKTITSPTKSYIAESGGIASKMKALLEKKSTISQSTIAHSIQEQRQKDLDLLLKRFNKNKDGEAEEVEAQSSEEDESEDEIISETTKMLPDRSAKIVQFKEKEIPPPPPPPPVPLTKPGGAKRRSKGDSPKVREVLEDVKRIRVSPPKAGRMYPCLSDIEASTENEQEATTAEPSPETSYDENCSVDDSDEPNTSFGREILQVVTKNQTPQKRPNLNDSTASELSDILDGMDDYLDEAMAHDDDSDSYEGPTPPKLGRNIPSSSNSFHFSKSSPGKAKQIYSPKKSSELPTHVVEGENLIPLTHTVSFYRKQQAQGSRTPVRQITRQPILTEKSPSKEKIDNSLEVSEKIQDLMNTVSKQQTVISQASQALNLCCSTIEFSGSSEQVEAERLLLVATQRRQAALHEVQRLRVEGTLHSGGDALVDKGTLSISEITLPLKKEYVRALSAAGGQGHHVVCLIRNAEHVIPTRLVSTFASPKDSPELSLRIPGSIKLEDVYSDFTVTVEVYSLQAQEELLPHDLKYHINTKKSGNKLTPKKKNDSKLIMPTVQSPAGPQAVRSPSFALVGYVVFSVQGINRKQWTLNNAPTMSPLEGIVQMRVQCELAVSVEYRGFLTMFDDVSGFGAWHRRWCLLKGHSLSYWKYPDDEKKKAPIDSINIQICSTKKVGLVSRDICARPNTFLLETVRPAKANDKDSLVTVCRGDKTIIRHLLSADTKEERLEWCEKFNKALNSIRLWKNN